MAQSMSPPEVCDDGPFKGYARLHWIEAAARARPTERCHALSHHLNPINLRRAFQELDGSKAVGIDRVTKQKYAEQLDANVEKLHGALRGGGWRPKPSRQVLIPKPQGGTRPLAVGCLEDKLVQTLVARILEALYEPIFSRHSFGFRRGKSAHQAVGRLYETICDRSESCTIVEMDIEKFLDASSYCTLICCEAVEEARHRVGELDFQAFSSSLPDVDSLEVATLYTLQDGLTADAQSERGFEHRDVAGWRVVNETCAQLIGDANAPRSAGRELLASDEAVVEPTVHRGRRDAENVCSAIDVDDLALLLRVGRLETRDLPVRAQAADAAGCEAQAFRAGLALSIEDTGDNGIRVVRRETAYELNSVLVGANRRGLRTRQMHIELSDEAATPTQDQMRVFHLALHVNDDFFDKRTEKLFTITIGGRRRRPNELDIFAERKDLSTLLGVQDSNFFRLALRQVCFFRLKLTQTFFPFSFEAARHQAVIWIDRTIASLSALRFISCAFDLELELSDDGILIGLDLLSCGCSGRSVRAPEAAQHLLSPRPRADGASGACCF